MQYAIEILERRKRNIEKSIKGNNLMQSDMRKATQELSKIIALKKAIKILKFKNKKR